MYTSGHPDFNKQLFISSCNYFQEVKPFAKNHKDYTYRTAAFLFGGVTSVHILQKQNNKYIVMPIYQRTTF